MLGICLSLQWGKNIHVVYLWLLVWCIWQFYCAAARVLHNFLNFPKECVHQRAREKSGEKERYKLKEGGR